MFEVNLLAVALAEEPASQPWLSAIAVGGAVGIFSGLLGSILGPQISHNLARTRRREERRERNHQQIRDMLEERMQDGRSNIACAFQIKAEIKARVTPLEALQRGLAGLQARRVNAFVWRPHRIEDEDLRNLAERLNGTVNQLFSHIVEVISLPEAEWEPQYRSLENDFLKLCTDVDKKLDELAW